MAGSMMREVDGVLRMMESIGRMFGGFAGRVAWSNRSA